MEDKKFYLDKLEILHKNNSPTQITSPCRQKLIKCMLPKFREFPYKGFTNSDLDFILRWFEIDKSYFVRNKFP